MKKIVITLSGITMGLMIIAGCGGTKEQIKVEQPGLAKEFANAPQWVLNPSSEIGLAAVGSAKIGPAGQQFARTEAMANGRDELARIMTVKVNNMVKNFTQVTGIGDAQTVDKVSSQISKQVASEVLNGSRQKDLWVSPGGEMYVLVIIDPTVVKEKVKENTITSYKNDEALWQQFQAKNGQEELSKEVEKEFSQSKGE